MKKVFLIGFDLCGGLALHRYFIANKFQSTFEDEDGFSSTAINNFKQGIEILNGYEDCQFFSQIQHETADGQFIYSSEELWAQLYTENPNALFIFNSLPVEKWLEKRKASYGYLPKVMTSLNLEEAQVLAVWRKAYDDHKSKVLGMLSGMSTFFNYDYSVHTISDLNNFFSRHNIKLDGKKFEADSEVRGSVEQRFHIQNIREAALYYRYHRFDIDTAISLLEQAEKHQPCRYYFKDELEQWKLEKKTWMKE
ncbi:hypothetical protein [Pseudoalteromonas sp. MMG005]|uniref:hypothetical protein n=1 Tax=Pseudoalteromonas sp. MMG005 TaxID=2822682 RepID=UPI001B39F69A|nr:hypothetical protein [Pseudoalteromonas sp. MMG005]MBQ4845067.1 hypothetical protein [Pseudoalteromonas sp. MMG005]